MKVIYSSQTTVQFDGDYYYSNAIRSTYERYLTLGDEIVVLCHVKEVEKPTHDRLQDNRLTIVPVKKQNSLKSLISHSQTEHIVKELVKNADVCVAHVPCAHSYLLINYARLFNKPYLTVVCGCPWDALWNYDWRGKLMAPMAYLTLKRVMKDVPCSIYVTNEFLQNRYPTNGKSIGCSNVNMHTGVSGVLEKRLDNIRKKDENLIYRIGTAAALDVPYKGQAYVIKAISKMKKMGLNFEYHLIGGGTGNKLKEIASKLDISDRVIIHGSIPHDQVADFFDSIDIYIQPSKQEGLPRAAIEAMSRGCLCMGSNIAGIPELLDNHYLFEKGSVSKIVEILKNITIEDLLEQASRNYNLAKEYDCDVLNERRRKFLEDFKNDYLK